jgi:hypothetical protein
MRKKDLIGRLLFEILPIGNSSPLSFDARYNSFSSRLSRRAARSGRRSESEIPMRVLALAMSAIGTVAVAASVRAQTYSPDYPVCLHVYGRGSYIECGYTSLAQCQATAQGRSAQCELNPYFALNEPAVPVHRRRHR